MIDVRLFRAPAFSASLAVNFLTIFVAIGYFLFVAQYLQLVLGLSPLEAGVWSVPSAIAFIVGSNAAPRLLRYIRPAFLIGIALGVAAVGLGILSRVGGADSDGLAIVVGSSVIISLGLAPVFGLTTELVVGSAPPERAGAASGISESAFELGGALGISILGSIGIAIYRRDVADALPAGVPAEAAVVAQDTLGGAVGVAQDLPAALGGDGPRRRPERVRRGHAGRGCDQQRPCGGRRAVRGGGPAQRAGRRHRVAARGSGAGSHLDGRGPRRSLLRFRSASRTSTRNSPARSERRRTASLCRVRRHAGREVSNRSKEDQTMPELDAKDRDDLRSNQFAYVDKDGGEHLPLNDASHVRNAMARFNQTDFESQTAKEAARKKILAAAKRYDIEVDEDSNVAEPVR